MCLECLNSDVVNNLQTHALSYTLPIWKVNETGQEAYEKGSKYGMIMQDAGFQFGFETIRVKFKPSAKDMQKAEESGTDLAQALLKQRRKEEKQSVSQPKNRESLIISWLLFSLEGCRVAQLSSLISFMISFFTWLYSSICIYISIEFDSFESRLRLRCKKTPLIMRQPCLGIFSFVSQVLSS